MLCPPQMKHTVNKRIELLRRPLAAGLGAALVVSIAMAVPASEGAPEQPDKARGAEQATDLYQGIPQHGNELGDASAPVTMVEISDLQCPFCQSFAIGTLPVIVERYVRTGQVRIVFHILPALGADSERAARAADAAALQDRMFPFVDLFFHNQGRERSGYVTDGFLRRLATGIPGLDVDRMMADRDSEAVTDQIAKAHRMAADIHLQSVPTVLVGKTGGELRVLGASESPIGAIGALLPKG
jgi:protein-disulfide isomerase